MRFRQILRRLAVVVAAAILAPAAIAQTATAVEYRHADWGYYFLTAYPAEVALLDGGAFNGVWQRTGQTFAVYAQPAPGVHPTCRFFSTSFAPKSSHFYTPLATECEIVNHNPDWQFEAIAFHLALPDANGLCATGTTALYRLYNNGAGGAPNHRYAASQAVFDATVAAGWTPEGHPQTNVFACVPSPPASGSALGPWIGTTDGGETVRGFVLDDSTYWFLVLSPSGEAVRVIQGSASTAAGVFASSDGRDFPVATPGNGGQQVHPVSIAGTFVAQSSMQLTLTGGTVHTITATFDAARAQPAPVAPAAGSYVGHAGHTSAGATAFTIDGSGGISGEMLNNCPYTGVFVPAGASGAFNLSITMGGHCASGTGAPRLGLAYHDAARGLFQGFTLIDDRANCFHVVGAKL